MKNHLAKTILATAAAVASLNAPLVAQTTVPANAPKPAGEKSVKVFILAGQSNMEGKAPNALLDHQATNASTKALFAHLRKNDHWIVRDDVFIKFLERKGALAVGYGSPGRTGPELEFGTVMGYHYLGSAIWFNRIGHAMGDAMKNLIVTK